MDTNLPILSEVAAKLADIQEASGAMQRIGCKALPIETDIELWLDTARFLLFPGYFNKPGNDQTTCEAERWNQLSSFSEQLTALLGKLQDQTLASTTAKKVILALPDIARELVEDLDAAYMGDPSTESREEIVYSYPGFRAVTIYRLAHVLLKLNVPLLPRRMTEIAHSKTGIDIHPGARIGRHFFIDHGTGVVIGETCVIGNNVKIYQGVTLGALSFARDAAGELVRHTKRHPTIEDGVVIYANATILGGGTVIGHNSVIGSSVWLNQSINPHTIVTLEKPLLRYRGQHGDAVIDFQI